MDGTAMTTPEPIHQEIGEPLELDKARLPVSVWGVIGTIAGVLALLTAVAGIGKYVAVVAIVCGHVGNRDIRNGRRAGGLLATGGTWLGYATLALMAIGAFVRTITEVQLNYRTKPRPSAFSAAGGASFYPRG
jgi:hypothetical protein